MDDASQPDMGPQNVRKRCILAVTKFVQMHPDETKSTCKWTVSEGRKDHGAVYRNGKPDYQPPETRALDVQGGCGLADDLYG